MKSLEISLSLSQFNRFLRRSFIDRAVIFLKYALIAVSGMLLLFLIVQTYSGILQTSTKLAEFDNKIAAALQSQSPETLATSTERRKYSEISDRAVFGAVGVRASPIVTPVPTARAAVNTALTLIGTFLQDRSAPYAIIEEQKKKTQDIFVLNETVFDEAKLVAIYPDRVELNRNGQIEVLSLDLTPDRPSDGGAAAPGEEEFVVDEAELNRALENLPLLLTQARAVPYFKEGRAVGLRLFAIRAGSLFEKLGLQNGDVLKTVNANSLADLSQAMQLFQKLKEERSIALVLERNSSEKTFRYQIR